MLGSNFALLVRSPGDDGQQLLTTGSRLVCISLSSTDKLKRNLQLPKEIQSKEHQIIL